jgi:hypothetical protein
MRQRLRAPLQFDGNTIAILSNAIAIIPTEEFFPHMAQGTRLLN